MDQSAIMKNDGVTARYLKTDEHTIISERHIKWVKKMGECFEVCTKSTGCDIEHGDTHTICKQYNPDSYNKLNIYFE
jgi:hypothetical protein